MVSIRNYRFQTLVRVPVHVITKLIFGTGHVAQPFQFNVTRDTNITLFTSVHFAHVFKIVFSLLFVCSTEKSRIKTLTYYSRLSMSTSYGAPKVSKKALNGFPLFGARSTSVDPILDGGLQKSISSRTYKFFRASNVLL